MARVPYLTAEQVKPEDRDLLDRGLTLYHAFIHSPMALRRFRTLGKFIRLESRLDGRLRELAILQVGYLARAAYEWAHHIKIAHDFGATDEDIRGLIAETEGRSSALEPLAKTVLRGAREMTQEGGMRADTFEALEGPLGRECLVDLILAIAFYNGVVRVLASLEIDLEEDYLHYLEKFPLPADR
ncbi:MAG: carboxymuconolactone decarboxylase family protein [Alphaproteobacteria bacterium]